MTGLPQERDCFRSQRFAGDVRVVCGTGRPETARRETAALVGAGCDALVSFGICGALSPLLAAGTVVVANRVIDAGAGSWTPRRDWSERLLQQLDRVAPVEGAAVVGGDRMICEPVDKAAVFRRHAAVAVDMESHIVGEAAERAGIPFAVIRAVADTAAMRLPEAARVELDTRGNPRLAGVAWAVLGNPLQVPDLIRLAMAFRTAIRSLRRCADRLGADFRLFG